MKALRPALLDAAIASGLVAVAQVETWMGDYSPTALVSFVAFTATAPLAWRRRFPLLAMTLVIVSLLALAALGRSDDPVWLFAVLLLASYSAGANADRGRALAGLAMLLAFCAIAFALEPERGAGDFIFILIVFGGAWLLGQMMRLHRTRAAELEQETRRLEGERVENARRAVAEERARITRELHDVVTHSLTVMLVQSAVVRRRIAEDHPEEAELLREGEEAGRRAIAEMRRLLGLLRSGEEEMDLAPQPGLEDLPQLVEQMRGAGLDVNLGVEGERAPLPPGIDLAAYRIAQEALTNSLKHGGSAPARVLVRYRDGCVEVAVDDDGPARSGPADDGSGHGLVGMRERVALYGGELQAGPRPEGGFAVRATLPLE